jgi:hypothetical protein
MNALRIVFKTGRFNLSKVGENFINPCCFGEDVAAFLRQKLTERNIHTQEPYQEDWGWELPVQSGDQSYFLCMSGNADDSVTNPDDGEWGIIVEKKRTIWQRLTGSAKIATDDPMLLMIEEILSAQPGIREIRLEEN